MFTCCFFIHTLYINSKLVPMVEGDPKAYFSIATTPRYLCMCVWYINEVFYKVIISNEKWEMTHDRRNQTAKSRKNKYALRKGNLQILGNIGSWHHQTSGNERKIKKEYLRRIRKLLESKLYSRNLIKEINTWADPL